MCYRLLRLVLIMMGAVLLVAAVVPVVALLHIDESWVPAYMASKLLIMLPVGALCLLGAAGLTARLSRG